MQKKCSRKSTFEEKKKLSPTVVVPKELGLGESVELAAYFYKNLVVTKSTKLLLLLCWRKTTKSTIKTLIEGYEFVFFNQKAEKLGKY